MSNPLPVEHFRDQLLAAQQVLNAALTEPIINGRALLILSRPVSSVLILDHVMLVMEFFGIFWIHGPLGAAGFFETEEEAVMHLMGFMTVPE